jgi:aminoglycoside 6'-N-acetyltransferase I
MIVRLVEREDKSEWLRMRTALWPESPGDHEPEISEFLVRERPGTAVFVAEQGDGHLCGFIECGSRAYAEGCLTSPVGYIEGWWVDPDFREQGPCSWRPQKTGLVCRATRR